MSLVDIILGKKKRHTYDDSPVPNDEILKDYTESLAISTGYIRIEGPFLCEHYALKYLDLYKDLLKKTYYNINVCISRQLPVISSDTTLETMDNVRAKLGILPYNHRFELAVSKTDFAVIGVDGCILLNTDDGKRIKTVLKKCPATTQELKQSYLL